MMEARVTSCKAVTINPDLVDVIEVMEALSWIKSKAWPKVDVQTNCLEGCTSNTMFDIKYLLPWQVH